jgi:hypothetical protein
MRIDVKYAANVQPGDLVAGMVRPDAPTRPVQNMASAMRVTRVDVLTPDPESPRRKAYRWHYGQLVGGAFGPIDQVLVIVP